MEDEHVEQRLRAYRPAAPAPELRGRSLAEVAQRRRRTDLWILLTAAAALLFAALLLHSATERIDRRIAVAPVSAGDVDPQALDELALVLGDDANARLVARVILLRERLTAPVSSDPEVQ